MAFLILNTEITIGDLKFTGVHNVRVRRGMLGYAESATIELPHVGYRQIKGQVQPVKVDTFQLFEDGDAVTIKAGYNGRLRTEFEGFVKRRLPGMPVVIECEGYVRELRLQVNIDKYYASTTAKDLLKDICAHTKDVSAVVPVNFPLSGMHLVNANGTDVLDHIKRVSERALNIFFISPKVLWCGLTYTSSIAGKKVFDTPTVQLRLGWNVKRDNELKQRTPKEPVQVFLNGTLVTGDAVRTASKDKSAERKYRAHLNNVNDPTTLQKFAQELADRMNYTGYEGFINAKLEPYVEPGYYVEVVDAIFPERNGLYLCESTEVTTGVSSGGNRRIGIGPKIS